MSAPGRHAPIASLPNPVIEAGDVIPSAWTSLAKIDLAIGVQGSSSKFTPCHLLALTAKYGVIRVIEY
jgi:hypothetical protein